MSTKVSNWCLTIELNSQAMTARTSNAFRSCFATTIVLIVAVLTFAPNVSALTQVQSDDFSGFSCPGAWLSHPSQPGVIEYQQCSNGWMAERVIDASCVGDVNLSAMGNPRNAVIIQKPGSNCVAASNTLYKSYQIQKGQTIDSISFDLLSSAGAARYTVEVYDGKVSDLRAGQLPAKIYQSSSSAPTMSAGDVTQSFLTSTITSLVPSTDHITLAISGSDSSGATSGPLLIDNVSVSQTVATAAMSSLDYGVAWDQYFPDNGANGSTSGADLAVDGSGNVYVTGAADIDYNGFDIHTVKYDSSGNQVWAASYDSGYADVPVAMVLDSAGNIYVAGSTSGTGSDTDILLIKYDNAGSQQWSRVYNAAGADDLSVAVLVDSLDNIIVAGTSSNGTNNDFVTIKFDGAGTQLWMKRFDGGGNDQLKGIDVDSNDNVYITGASDAAGSVDIVILRYATVNGAQDWLVRYVDAAHVSPAAISVRGTGSAGDVYISGDTFGLSRNNVTIAYDTQTGSQNWLDIKASNAYSGSADMALVSDGLIVTRTSATFNTSDIETTKYNLDGSEAWVSTYDNAGGLDKPVTVTTDSNDNIYLAGISNENITTLVYDNLGNQISVLNYDSGGADSVAAIALAQDSLAGVTIHVTGKSFTGISNEMLALKYQQMRQDLDALSITGPASVLVGDSISLTSTVSNIHEPPFGSAADATGFDLGVYLAPTTTTPDVTINDSFAGFTCAANPWAETYPYMKPSVGAIASSVSRDCGNNTYVVVNPLLNASNSLVGQPGTNHIVDNLHSAGHAQMNAASNAGNLYFVRQYDIGNAKSFNLSAQYRVAGYSGNSSQGARSLGYFYVYDGAVSNPDGQSPTVLATHNYVGPVTAWGAFQNVSFTNLVPSSNIITVAVRVWDASQSSPATEIELDNVQITAPQFNSIVIDQNQWYALSTLSVPALASGDQVTVNGSVAVTSVPNGDYTLVAKADSADAIAEFNETNNITGLGTSSPGISYAPVNVLSVTDAFELSPGSISTATGSVFQGDTFAIDYSVDNTRNPAVSNVPLKFVLSPDTVIGNGNDITIGTDVIPSISGNTSATGSINITVALATPAASYYLGIIVDDGNTIVELNETNNTLLTTGQITIVQTPDLSIGALTGPQGGVAGAAVTIVNSVQASFVNVNTPFDIGFYLSVDNVIDVSDTLIGVRNITSMLAGQTNSDNTSLTLPAGLTNGVYYLGAIVDNADSVFETNEANNTRNDDSGSSISIVSSALDPTPDLIVSSVSAPSTAAYGDTITVNNSVENVLPGSAAGAFDVGIYLSTDPVITPSDTLLGSRTIAGLTGNSSNAAATLVTLPPEPVVSTETFTGFSCPGPDTATSPANSYTRSCSHGVTLFTEDRSATYDPQPPTSVDADYANVRGGTGIGRQWILKTFDVTGLSSVDISARMRLNKTSAAGSPMPGGVDIFDGTVINTAGLTPLANFSTTCDSISCAWLTPSFTGLTPVSNTITIGFWMQDAWGSLQPFMEVDDVSVPGGKSIPVPSATFYIGAIADNPVSQAPAALPGTVNQWHMDEGIGNTVNDSVGTSNAVLGANNDDFDDGLTGSAFRAATNNASSSAAGTGSSSVTPLNGAIELQTITNATGATATYNSAQVYNNLDLAHLSGDFDVSIDYSIPGGLVSTSLFNVYIRFTIHFTTNDRFFIERQTSNAGNRYVSCARLAGTTSCKAAVTTRTSGKLRLHRAGATLTTYYWDNGAWQQLHQVTNGSTVPPIEVSVTNYGQRTSNLTLTTLVDNYQVNGTSMWSWTNAGKFSSALQFDGIDDYATLPSLAGVDTATPDAKTTVEFWMYWDGVEGVMPFGWTSYDLYFNNGSFGFNSKNGDIYGVSSSGLANRWVHIAAIFNNGLMTGANQLYIDGVQQSLVQQQGAPVSRNVSATATIAGWNDNLGYRFGGKIDDLAIHAGALAAGTIQAHATGLMDKIDEVNENNNALVMGGVSPSSTVVGITKVNPSSANSSGGGAFGWLEMIIGVLGVLFIYMRLQRRIDKHDCWLR